MSERLMPMHWVPRWMDAYYSNDSTLHKFYYLGLYYYPDLMKQVLRGQLTPNFYGELAPDRFLTVAKYDYPKSYIPNVRFNVSFDSATGIVRQVDSMGSLLYELTDLVYYISDSNFYIKNVEVRCVSGLIAASGFLDLSTEFVTEAIDSDSPIIIKNEFDDFIIVDQTSNSYFSASGHVLVPQNGTYSVYYRSQRRIECVSGVASSDLATLRIDNSTVSLAIHYIKNVWDEFALQNMIVRNKWETNEQLKTRCQHLTLAIKPNQKISAALGRTVGISWYASGVAVSVSGYNDWQLQLYDRAFYFKEKPAKDGTSFLLTYAPTGHIQLFLNNNLINENSYIVSGSYIIPSSNLLRDAEQGQLEANYKSQRMTKRNILNCPDTLEAVVPDDGLYRGILVRDVLIENIIKKIKPEEWKWNKVQGSLTGLAEFDF